MRISSNIWRYVPHWLTVQPKFLISVLILVFVSILATKNGSLPYKIKVLIASLILFYYMCITFRGTFSTPTLTNFHRMNGNGMRLFNPNMNFRHYTSPMNLNFIFNSLIFIPIGMLCPIISEAYGKFKYVFLFGFGVSLLIETSHLFTQHKATDINELVANMLGMVLGYALFIFIRRMTNNNFLKRMSKGESRTWILPIMAVLTAFVYNFFS